MIKRYLEFIRESDETGFDMFGQWVESLYSDEYVKNIVNRYIGEIGSDIRLAIAAGKPTVRDRRYRRAFDGQGPPR